MEYVQERIATLHDITGRTPNANVDNAAVVIPMKEREYATAAAEHVFSELERIKPGRIIIALRASGKQVVEFTEWFSGFEIPIDVVWCASDQLAELLSEHGLNGQWGKGLDLWLAIGIAARSHQYVICHDVDNKTYESSDIFKLLFPLEYGFEFTKGYYSRIENNRLYGRLFRLYYLPIVRALADMYEAPIIDYLLSFRYALAGEFAMTAELANQFRIERRFGLEVGTLGDSFDLGGFTGTAQIDLGQYEHNHKPVRGDKGLAEMSEDVGTALFRVVQEHGISPDYQELSSKYQDIGRQLVSQYEVDAVFNGLGFDRGEEQDQIDLYVDSIQPPMKDDRLPRWDEVGFNPESVLTISEQSISDLT